MYTSMRWRGIHSAMHVPPHAGDFDFGLVDEAAFLMTWVRHGLRRINEVGDSLHPAIQRECSTSIPRALTPSGPTPTPTARRDTRPRTEAISAMKFLSGK